MTDDYTDYNGGSANADATKRPVNATIIKIVDETPSIKTFFFDTHIPAGAGQFSMVWVRGVDEIPMSMPYTNGITVQKVGDATSALFALGVGDSVGLRGPFGNTFDIPDGARSILLIGGGVGAAPLAPLAEAAKKNGIAVTTIIGARSASELVFQRRFEDAGKLIITTDDGSAGHHGFVTDLLDSDTLDTVDLDGFDAICICGPEPMMVRILDIAVNNGVEAKTQFSLHRYFKCAIGVCGACCIDDEGLRVCKDGPVISGDRLVCSEFGKYKRDASSRKVYF